MSENEFLPATQEEKDPIVGDMLVSRQAQEVQAAMIVAKKFPRDEARAYDRIMTACQRKGLAEEAEYTYPKGGKNVSGPSIRLAESLAKIWGNLDYGIIELSNRNGVSDMMAYAWDLETNTRITKIFSVRHWRDTRQGGHALTDIRDIYELTANYGARRVRACILGIIPGDITEAAVNKCRETIKGSYKTPLEDRFKKMIVAFDEEFNVGQKQIEEYLGCNMNSFDENHFLRIKGVYRSLRDGMASVKDFFKTGAIQTGAKVEDPLAPVQTPPVEQIMISNASEDVLRKQLKELHPNYEDWQIDALIKERKA